MGQRVEHHDAGLRVEHHDGACLIVLDRPQRRNALNVATMGELIAAIREQSAREDVAVLVLTGEGAFCAGADLRDVVRRQAMPAEERRAALRAAAQGLTWALMDSPVPTLAAVDGPAVGLGFDLALACDDRLIGPDGWCQQGWGRIGAIPAAGGELLLRLRNPGLLWRLLAEQPRIGGPDAERWGIAQAVAGTSARQAALARAAALARMPRPALLAYVRLARARLRTELAPHLDLCAEEQPRLLADPGLAARVAGVLDVGRD